jgi:hypothetical protein
MADLRLDKEKAQKIITQVLRDEGRVLPDKANELGRKASDRLHASMAMPIRPALQGFRMIPSSPSYEQREHFISDVKKYLADVDERTARKLWEIVYSYGRDLPDDIVV